MAQLISQIKLPANIDTNMLDAQNITIEVLQNYEEDLNGTGFQILVRDAAGNVIYNCPQPCPRVMYPSSSSNTTAM